MAGGRVVRIRVNNVSIDSTIYHISVVAVAALEAGAGVEDIADVFWRFGAQSEKAVEIVKNTTKIFVNGRTRIPDGLTSTTLTEVKNVARLSLTSQLRDFMQYAKEEGLQMILIIRTNTRLSPALDRALTEIGATVIRDDRLKAP